MDENTNISFYSIHSISNLKCHSFSVFKYIYIYIYYIYQIYNIEYKELIIK